MEAKNMRTMVVYKNESGVSRIQVRNGGHDGEILATACPNGPDGVFVIYAEKEALTTDVELLVQELEERQIPFMEILSCS